MDRQRVKVAIAVATALVFLLATMVGYPEVYWDTFPFRYVPSALMRGISVFMLVAAFYWAAWYAFLLARSIPLLTITDSGFTNLTKPAWTKTIQWADVAAITVTRAAWGGAGLKIRRTSTRWPWGIDARLLAEPFQNPERLQALLEHRGDAQAE